jgi:pimeloyl-ACP methyl ester carboxylesterase
MRMSRCRRADGISLSVWPWRDGSTALLLDPVELLERLAALVPQPRRLLVAPTFAHPGTPGRWRETKHAWERLPSHEDPIMSSQLSSLPVLDARWGYFFVGGHYTGEGVAREMSGQMYVQVIEPATVTQRYPIVMIPGIGATGNCFIATPDGRAGWVHDFASRGYRVYVVDQVGRGRSGSSSKLYGEYATLPMDFIQQFFAGRKASALWPQARLHTQWPEEPLPGNRFFDQLVAQLVPYISSPIRTEEVNLPANLALLEKIGPAIVLTHSQSGVFGWKLADLRPDLVGTAFMRRPVPVQGTDRANRHASPRGRAAGPRRRRSAASRSGAPVARQRVNSRRRVCAGCRVRG